MVREKVRPWREEQGEVLARRAEALSERLAKTVLKSCPSAQRGLDVGGGDGVITGSLAKVLKMDIVLLDPDVDSLPSRSETEVRPVRGSGTRLPFRDTSFDVVFLVSVLEHVSPRKNRLELLREARRVLRKDGIVVGQVPNMNFPVEIHSKLPLLQFLPRSLARPYFDRCSPVPAERKSRYGINWYRVGPTAIHSEAQEAGFCDVAIWGANLPRAALPSAFRFAAPITRLIPMNYDFCFRR